MNMQHPEHIACEIARRTGAAFAGVAVHVERAFGRTPLFVIWAVGRDGKITSHQLDAHCTDDARLEAHVRGFIENHRAAFGKGVR